MPIPRRKYNVPIADPIIGASLLLAAIGCTLSHTVSPLVAVVSSLATLSTGRNMLIFVQNGTEERIIEM